MFSAAAQECHLYPMELEHARHTLVEARKVPRLERWGALTKISPRLSMVELSESI